MTGLDLSRWLPAGLLALGAWVAHDPVTVRSSPSAATHPVSPVTQDEARAAVARVVPLMQQSADTWFEKRSCSSCHHQGVGTLAMAMLQERGFAVDTARLRAQAARTMRPAPNWQERYVVHEVSINQPIGQSYRLIGAVAAGHPVTDLTRAAAHMLAGEQHAGGRWSSSSHRPPLEDSEVTSTVLSLRVLSLVPLPRREAEFRERVARARRWLARQLPASTEERAMQLLGLAWAGASPRALRPYAEALLAEQREDGGWAQVATRPSDAYATGQVLTVLMQAARVAPGDARVQRGLRYLLAAQERDGSWHVDTRRTMEPGLPYFETGFPHGKDQFISYAGTAWGVMALASSLSTAPSRALMGRPAQTVRLPADTVPDGLTPLHRAALHGTVDEVRTLVAGGADVNAASPLGVTPLMAAVHDAAKVRLLLDAGASLDAATRQGHTALQLAAAYDGGSASARLLLARGAAPDRALTASNAARTAALSYALLRGDTALASLLLARGASIIGPPGSGDTPLIVAAWTGDADAAEWLVRNGAPVDDPGPPESEEPTPLMVAAAEGQGAVLRVLLRHGAQVGRADDDGHTALHLAGGAPDRGTTAVVDALLAAGASPTRTSRQGETPAALALRYGKAYLVARLSADSVRR